MPNVPNVLTDVLTDVWLNPHPPSTPPSSTGQNGSVVILLELSFAKNGDASSCTNNCLPTATDAAAVRQAYALGLRPIVRLGQWPRTIRDFSDDAAAGHHQYTALAGAYRTFTRALPLPPDGRSLMNVIVLNEPNVCSEWACSNPGSSTGSIGSTGSGVLPTHEAAAEVAACMRDIVAALRPLPRLRLSVAPTAYTGPASCSCDGSPNPPVNFSQATDLAYMQAMLAAVPGLYNDVDFFSSHPYPWGHSAPFSDPLGRAGELGTCATVP